MASVTSPSRTRAGLLLRLSTYDLLAHVRPTRWLALPGPVLLAGWVAAEELDRGQHAWTPGDLIGAVMTTPLLVGLLLGLPILVLTVDLPLRQLLDGEAVLTFTRVGDRGLWWAAKLLAVVALTFAASLVCVGAVWVVGALRSGSLSLLHTSALASLLGFDLPSTAAGRQLLVLSSPLLLTLVIAPIAALSATIGAATRRLGLAGLVGALLAMSAPFQWWLVDVLPAGSGGLLPGASVLLPPAAVTSEVAIAPFLAGSIGWIVLSSAVGGRTLEDLR
jgi:hypothetical protein